MRVPSGIWAVASELESAEQTERWSRSAAEAAAFTVRRCPSDDATALDIMRILSSNGRWLASHGRADLARLSKSQAVIAGVRSLSVKTYCEEFNDLSVGASTHDEGEVHGAIAAGARFLFFGPVWDTPEKTGILAPRGIQGLREIVALGVPVIAIGGISSPEQVAQVKAAGAHRAAVLRAARDAALMAELASACT